MGTAQNFHVRYVYPKLTLEHPPAGWRNGSASVFGLPNSNRSKCTEGLGVRHRHLIPYPAHAFTNMIQFESLVRRLFALLRPPACSHERGASFGTTFVLIGRREEEEKSFTVEASLGGIFQKTKSYTFILFDA
jgi:hypothetical protein